MSGIISSYNQLKADVAADGTSGDTVYADAEAFLAAIQANGSGSYGDMEAAAQNIANSLHDGTYSQSGSVSALDTAQTTDQVSDAGQYGYDPDGVLSSDPIGQNIKQGSDGDCVSLATIKAFSTTPQGAEILKESVKKDADGSYEVKLPGDPSTVYKFSLSDLKGFTKHSDPYTSAIVAALYQKAGAKPSDGLNQDFVNQMLGGSGQQYDSLSTSNADPASIEAFLQKYGPSLGNNVALTLDGGSNQLTGHYHANDPDHEYTIVGYDAANQTVQVANPWDANKSQTISIQSLAESMSGQNDQFNVTQFS